MAMKPRMAPTTMKTVPSGMVLCCMKGACLVLGTTGVTIVATPVNVGRFVGSDGSPVAALVVEDVSFGTVAADVPVVPVVPVVNDTFVAVFVAALVLPVFVAADVLPFVCVTVERPGCCADAPMANSDTARAVERPGVFGESLMMNMRFNCCAKKPRRPWTSAGSRCRTMRRGRNSSMFLFVPNNQQLMSTSEWRKEVKSEEQPAFALALADLLLPTWIGVAWCAPG